jgi:septal ring factor EnvC (AmiA/AmiB activator)
MARLFFPYVENYAETRRKIFSKFSQSSRFEIWSSQPFRAAILPPAKPSVWRRVMRAMKEEVMEERVPQWERNFAELRSDVVGLKTDVSRLQSDVSHLQSDVAELKTDVREIRADIASLRTEMTESAGTLRTEMTESIGRLRAEMTESIGLLRAEMKDMHRSLRESDLMTRIWMLLSLATVLGVMARGFKWV